MGGDGRSGSRSARPGGGSERGSTGGRGPGRLVRAEETPELRRLRRRVDSLDRRIVALLNARARLGLEIGRAKHALGRRDVRDAERESEVLMRVALANPGPLPQAELLALYRRLVAATRTLETRQREALDELVAEDGTDDRGDAGADDGTGAGGHEAGAADRRTGQRDGRPEA